MKSKLIPLVLLIFLIQFVKANPIGDWSFSSAGLPVYHYMGELPFTRLDKEGEATLLPKDPYFLLGNYRMALVAHASGVYQFLTAERAWARINGTEQPNYGCNDAHIVFKNNKNKKVNLVGIHSMAANNELVKKDFGVGFARYEYQMENGITCTRIISVKPSAKINSGNPSFVLTVHLENNGKRLQELVYSERMLVNFVLNGTQYVQPSKRRVFYGSDIQIDGNQQMAIADISYKTNTFLTLPAKDERYMYDLDPPSVFMLTKNAEGEAFSSISAKNDTLCAQFTSTLNPGETKIFNVVIGLADHNTFTGVQEQVDELLADANMKEPMEGLFAGLWKSRLPDLSSEKNEVLRREMLWNAHMVEASAKYSQYYSETFIPQGTVYSYHFGDNISNRDHLQAALSACYTNPELAKSCIRYVIKHSETDGEIKRGNSGYGYTQPSLYKESDEQLFFFNTLSEYLLITRDFDFLNEQVAYFPAEYGKADLVLNILIKYFIYLRDEIGRGPNGLVRILNSDWSDSFFHKYSPNVYAGTAESHLNSAMVLAIFPKLIDVLKQSGNSGTDEFIQALEEYRVSVESAFMNDLGDRKFAARAYLNHKLRFGVDKVCIEPQGYLLQIPNLPVERKKEIYEYVKSKLLAPEKIGVRTREEPLWGGTADGEDGGIWYSLEYPVLLGVSSFDKKEAESLLMKFSFDNHSRHYPDYWIGHWTAPDEINSTLYREGLYSFWVPGNERATAFQGYCSHPHTWPLFCYFKLRE